MKTWQWVGLLIAGGIILYELKKYEDWKKQPGAKVDWNWPWMEKK